MRALARRNHALDLEKTTTEDGALGYAAERMSKGIIGGGWDAVRSGRCCRVHPTRIRQSHPRTVGSQMLASPPGQQIIEGPNVSGLPEKPLEDQKLRGCSIGP